LGHAAGEVGEQREEEQLQQHRGGGQTPQYVRFLVDLLCLTLCLVCRQSDRVAASTAMREKKQEQELD